MHQLPHNISHTKWDHPCKGGEALFLGRFFTALQSNMGASFEDWNFVVHHRVQGERHGAPVTIPKGNDQSVLFLLCDERERFPLEQVPGYRWVFRSYLNHHDPASRVHPFPIGYQNAVGLANPIPFEHRKVSVFFSGNLNRNRVDLYRQFRPIPFLPKRNLQSRHMKELVLRFIHRAVPQRNFNHRFPGSILSFTEGFMQGLPQDHYAKTLANTRIAICPPGFVSNETIRHWEAMKMGCVIITSPLPSNRFYRGSPMIVLQKWADLMPVLENLLQDPVEMMQRHIATRDWWNKVCCEEAVASYVADRISR